MVKKEQQWLTVGQICKKTGMPESTVRRYLERLEDFIQASQFDHITKYNSNCIDVLIHANNLYKNKKATEEVISILEQEGFNKTVNINVVGEDNHHPTTTQENLAIREMQNLKGVIQDLTEKVGNLENKLERREKQLEEKLEERDQKLMETIRELQEKKKPWWKRIFNKE